MDSEWFKEAVRFLTDFVESISLFPFFSQHHQPSGKAKNMMNRRRSERYADDLTIRSDVSVSSKQRISPFFGGKLVALLAC